MLPSPAWNTLATRNPYLSMISRSRAAHATAARAARCRPCRYSRRRGRSRRRPTCDPSRSRSFHGGLAFLDALDVVLDLAISMMLLQHRVHLVVGALDLDDQQRLDIHRITGMGEGLADVDGLGLSMNSMATGMMPAPMMSATQAPATSEESKPNSTGRAPSGLASRRTVASVTMPSWPSDPQIRPSRS
jgi:hypothetical protein